MTFEVRTNVNGYSRELARLHINNINEGFLRSLGISTLSNLYEAIARSKQSILVLGFEEEKLIGFAAGTDNMKDLYFQLLLSPSALFSICMAILRNPKAILKIFEIFTYSFSSKRKKSLPRAELLSLCVDQKGRGRGLSALLYNELCLLFEKMGVSSFVIVVGGELEIANKFYSRMGAKIAGETEVHSTQQSNVYVHHLK